jgi:hypothetical protein
MRTLWTVVLRAISGVLFAVAAIAFWADDSDN